MSKYYSTTLQKGSTGYETKQWQSFLKSQGYDLAADGIFGDKTLAATKDYQTKNKLSATGVVDDKTFSIAGFVNVSNPVVAPNVKDMPTAPTYDVSTWDDSAKGSESSKAYNDAKYSVANYGDFVFSGNEWLESVKNSIANYGDFSYDVNKDALYQQYADKYIQQGKLAMEDTMGQAAAMTGGYANSYAQSVGQQAYEARLDQLNEIIPELYQMALDRYNMGKEDLYNQYGLLMSEYEREYGVYSDEYNKLLDALGIAKDDYYSGADMFYNEQQNQNSVIGQEFSDAMAIWENETDQAWKQANWDEAARQYGATVLASEKADYESTFANYSSNNSSNSSNNTSNQTSNNTSNNTSKEPENKPTTTGFSGSDYSEAVAYCERNGVPTAHASGIMTQSEWNRRKSSYQTTGTGGAEVKNYKTYEDYLADITAYLVEKYS